MGSCSSPFVYYLFIIIIFFSEREGFLGGAANPMHGSRIDTPPLEALMMAENGFLGLRDGNSELCFGF